MRDDIELLEGFRKLMNGRENDSDTPDFILADYLLDCLHTYEDIATRTNNWYGVGKDGRQMRSLRND